MQELRVDMKYPIELPKPDNLGLDGRNSFEPIVCELNIPRKFRS